MKGRSKQNKDHPRLHNGSMVTGTLTEFMLEKNLFASRIKKSKQERRGKDDI
jgi:hypothetical protein